MVFFEIVKTEKELNPIKEKEKETNIIKICRRKLTHNLVVT